jgi:hypothetical protein
MDYREQFIMLVRLSPVDFLFPPFRASKKQATTNGKRLFPKNESSGEPKKSTMAQHTD